jgi:Na+/H+ antiporter NhaA
MTRDRALKAVLVLVGMLFLAGIYPIVSSLWHATHEMYADDMMLSIYFALGVFLLLAARNPAAHRSLIAFTAWSSFAHASVMTVMGFQQPSKRGDFWVASLILVVIGAILLPLAPAKPSVERAAAA